MCGSTGFLAQGGEILGIGLTYSPIPFFPIHWTTLSELDIEGGEQFLIVHDGKQDEGSVVPVPGPGGTSSQVCDGDEDLV